MTLAEVEGVEELPTVRSAAERIFAAGGQLQARDGRLVVLPPARVSPDEPAEASERERLREAVRVLVAARDVIARREGRRLEAA